MRQQISAEDESLVISAYAQGQTQREISKHSNLSLGVVNKIIGEARTRTPDIEELRRFYNDLRSKRLGPIDVERTISLHEKLDDLGLTITQLSHCNSFLEKTGYGEQTLQRIKSGMLIHQLEQKYGISCQKLLSWYTDIGPKVENIKKELSDLSKKKDLLETELQDLSELKKMKNNLLTKGITLNKIGKFLDFQQKIEELAFTKETAIILAAELSKIDTSPEAASNRLATYLKETQSLEEKKRILTSENIQLLQRNTTLKKVNVEKTNKLKEIEARIQRLIENEDTLIEEAVSQSERKAEEKIENIKTELTTSRTQLEVLNEEIRKKEKEYADLEAKKEDLKDRYILGEGLIQILQDPESTTLNQLRTLYKSANRAIEIRERGLLAPFSYDTDEAKKLIINILTKYVRNDLVSRHTHQFLKTNLYLKKKKVEQLEKENENLIQVIAKQDKTIKINEEAMGVSMLKIIKAEYQDVPIPVLKNIREWIDQIIKEKSGQTPYSRVKLSKETWKWFIKRIDKPEANSHLILKPVD